MDVFGKKATNVAWLLAWSVSVTNLCSEVRHATLKTIFNSELNVPNPPTMSTEGFSTDAEGVAASAMLADEGKQNGKDSDGESFSIIMKDPRVLKKERAARDRGVFPSGMAKWRCRSR